MLNDPKIPKKIKFLYEKSDDYKLIYANGIVGGATIRGELKFEFFLEHRPIQESDVHEVEVDGRLGGLIEQAAEEEAIMIRERKMGVIMSLRQARSVANWMLKKIDEVEAIHQQAAEGIANEDNPSNKTQ